MNNLLPKTVRRYKQRMSISKLGIKIECGIESVGRRVKSQQNSKQRVLIFRANALHQNVICVVNQGRVLRLKNLCDKNITCQMTFWNRKSSPCYNLFPDVWGCRTNEKLATVPGISSKRWL